MLKLIDGTKIPPGGVGVWAACKQDYALYGTEIYTSFKTETPVSYIFIGVECPLGTIPNAHTMASRNAEYSRHDMETIHYMNGQSNRQTCHLNIKCENGYNLSGAPMNFPD
jgi:hypothetical protein